MSVLTAHEKYHQLQSLLNSYGRVIIALSGGLDSSFLLYAAVKTLGTGNVFAAIGVSPSLAQSEFEAARSIAKGQGLKESQILIVETEELNDPNYSGNPPNRCFFCKSELYGKLNRIAEKRTGEVICDGANASDVGDHRPGMIAAKKNMVRSPLLESGLSKDEIRELAREFGLNFWDKPQSACLASRIPYGKEVTRDKLKQIELAESFLRSIGFRQLRVRHHGDIARIELPVNDMSRMLDNGLREEVIARFRELGFTFISLDINGFQSGSMNAILKGKMT